jgi:hypothetical protein
LEGSTLGATVLRPLIARAFLLTGEDWPSAQLRNRSPGPLGAIPAAHEPAFPQCGGPAQIVKAAGDFFQQLDSVFRALYLNVAA